VSDLLCKLGVDSHLRAAAAAGLRDLLLDALRCSACRAVATGLARESSSSSEI
jgi:hypothetical protein